MKEKYLPIGTVVLLRDAKKRVMIIGYTIKSEEDKNKIYDYLGCLYPEGVISQNEHLVFNHERIDKIIYPGLDDEEWKNFNSFIKESIKKIESENKVENESEV